MAVYKVPQNVEAEDKLLGPFTFKQFVFLMITAGSIFLAWGLFRISPALVIIPLPFIVFFGVLGIYRREDQPVETYLVAFLNFLFKPRKRRWSPEGFTETVKITAPKMMAPPQAKRNLDEVHGQLERLARIVDTRGWAVKRPELQEPINAYSSMHDDRLIAPDHQALLTQEPIDVHPADDILDPYNNPVAQNFDALVTTSAQTARAAAVARMRDNVQQTAAAGTRSDAAASPRPAAPVTPPPPPAILELSANDEISISQIAAAARRQQTSGTGQQQAASSK